ncbi:MAG: histidine phosphatase family protein [Phycisphaerales bacterium]
MPSETDPATTPDIELLVVRAGRTCWDESQRVQGRTDLPLTDRGREDIIAALDASTAMVPDRLAVVFTGPDEASQATAAIVADRFGGKVKTLDGLIGWDFGLWHGLHEDELAARYARAWERWVEDPTSVTPPNGEHADDVRQRLQEALARVLDKAASKPVGVVLRPLQMAMLARWLDGESIDDLWAHANRVPGVQRIAIDPDTMRGSVLASTAKAGTSA